MQKIIQKVEVKIFWKKPNFNGFTDGHRCITCMYRFQKKTGENRETCVESKAVTRTHVQKLMPELSVLIVTADEFWSLTYSSRTKQKWTSRQRRGVKTKFYLQLVVQHWWQARDVPICECFRGEYCTFVCLQWVDVCESELWFWLLGCVRPILVTFYRCKRERCH